MRILVLTALIGCGDAGPKTEPGGATASTSPTVETSTTEPTDGSTGPAPPVVALAPDEPDTTGELVAAGGSAQSLAQLAIDAPTAELQLVDV